MGQRAFIFCLVPRERAGALVGPLREHFAGDPRVAVLVERRAPDPGGRAATSHGDDRRAPVVVRDVIRALPPELRDESRHLRFVQRLAAVRRTHQDTDTVQLVEHILAGDPQAVTELWWRFLERVRVRLRRHLGDQGAEAAAGEVLGRILDELARYDSETPLASWIDGIVDSVVAERAAHGPPR